MKHYFQVPRISSSAESECGALAPAPARCRTGDNEEKEGRRVPGPAGGIIHHLPHPRATSPPSLTQIHYAATDQLCWRSPENIKDPQPNFLLIQKRLMNNTVCKLLCHRLCLVLFVTRGELFTDSFNNNYTIQNQVKLSLSIAQLFKTFPLENVFCIPMSCVAQTESPCTRIDPLIVIIYFVTENTSHVLIIHYCYNLHLHNTNTTLFPGQMAGTLLPLTGHMSPTSATSRRGEVRGWSEDIGQADHFSSHSRIVIS